MKYAFEITVADVGTVLSRNWASAVNTNGKSFGQMAEALFEYLDHDAISDAALVGGCVEKQTEGAYANIATQLIGMGILERPAARVEVPPKAPRSNDAKFQVWTQLTDGSMKREVVAHGLTLDEARDLKKYPGGVHKNARGEKCTYGYSLQDDSPAHSRALPPQRSSSDVGPTF